jgi:NAD(P)-dependent dehydrogenase (short-subunit alcohol dehydrogenase family)
MAASRVWLITGASAGIGLELAKIAASRGDRVIAASRSPKKLEGLTGITAARLDQNESLSQVQAAIKDIVDIYGTVDIVVNNAAYVQTGTVEETTTEETQKQFQANTFGPINVYRAILPHLRSKRSGTLVTLGSMAAWYPMNSCNLYNASKAALRWVVIGLAEEVKPFGIKHCLVEPGFFRTDLLKPETNFGKTTSETRLSDYAEINKNADEAFGNFHGTQLGNPVKGAQIIYDVITSSGIAAGRDLPGLLPLGSDASTEIAKSANSTIAQIDAWADVAAQSDYQEGK